MNDKVKNILLWTGLVGAIVSAIAYLIIIAVIVRGFETTLDRNKQLLISIIGAVDGLVIATFLKMQGISLAKDQNESKRIEKAYQEALNKDKPIKKKHTIKWFMFWSTVKDIVMKGLTITVNTYLLLYVFAEGNGDYSLFLLALSNIMMFASFGIISLSKAYQKYIEEHLPVIESITKQLNDQARSIESKGE